MSLSDFRCITRFRVPFCDINMAQHVGNAGLVVWSETIRGVYFDVVLNEPMAVANSIILASLKFDYEHPIDYREEVAVGCRVSRLGRKSFDFAFEIWSESRKVCAARGLTTMVAYNYDTKMSIPIPERWREVIATYEVLAPAMA